MRASAVLILIFAVTAIDPPRAIAQVAVEEAQMTVPARRFLIQAFVEINLSEDAAFEPLSIAPDLWFGITDAFTVGVIHSGRAATGLFGSVGNGLCLTGEDGGCPRVYDSLGLDVRYHLLRPGRLTLSAEGGLFARSFDPFTLALKLGVVGRWQSGALAIEAAPNLWIGLNERSAETTDTAARANKEVVHLPFNFIYGLTPRIALALQLGVLLPLEDPGDTYMFGLSLGGQYELTRQWFVDLAFSLPALAGGDLVETGGDTRTITLGVTYAR
jgi:hypothetical protein